MKLSYMIDSKLFLKIVHNSATKTKRKWVLKEKIDVKKVNPQKENKSKKNLAKQFGKNSVKDY